MILCRNLLLYFIVYFNCVTAFKAQYLRTYVKSRTYMQCWVALILYRTCRRVWTPSLNDFYTSIQYVIYVWLIFAATLFTAYSSGSGIPLSEVKIKHDSSVAPGPTVHYTDDTFKPPLDKGDEKVSTYCCVCVQRNFEILYTVYVGGYGTYWIKPEYTPRDMANMSWHCLLFKI